MELIAIPPARMDRLRRLGAYSQRDQSNEAYRRDRRAAEIRTRLLPQTRKSREMDRANREEAARKSRRSALRLRLERGFGERFRAIAARVLAEHRIRPAGKSPKSHHRFRDQMAEALAGDSEYQSVWARREQALGRIERQRRRLGSELIAAGVLACDTRETRIRKVAEYRSAKGDR